MILAPVPSTKWAALSNRKTGNLWFSSCLAPFCVQHSPCDPENNHSEWKHYLHHSNIMFINDTLWVHELGNNRLKKPCPLQPWSTFEQGHMSATCTMNCCGNGQTVTSPSSKVTWLQHAQWVAVEMDCDVRHHWESHRVVSVSSFLLSLLILIWHKPLAIITDKNCVSYNWGFLGKLSLLPACNVFDLITKTILKTKRCYIFFLALLVVSFIILWAVDVKAFAVLSQLWQVKIILLPTLQFLCHWQRWQLPAVAFLSINAHMCGIIHRWHATCHLMIWFLFESFHVLVCQI